MYNTLSVWSPKLISTPLYMLLIIIILLISSIALLHCKKFGWHYLQLEHPKNERAKYNFLASLLNLRKILLKKKWDTAYINLFSDNRNTKTFLSAKPSNCSRFQRVATNISISFFRYILFKLSNFGLVFCV